MYIYIYIHACTHVYMYMCLYMYLCEEGSQRYCYSFFNLDAAT